MNQIKPDAVADPTVAPAPNPEALAKRLFVLAMLGIIAYVSTILIVMSGSIH